MSDHVDKNPIRTPTHLRQPALRVGRAILAFGGFASLSACSGLTTLAEARRALARPDLFHGFQNQKRNRAPDEARPGLPAEGVSPKGAEAIAKARKAGSHRRPLSHPTGAQWGEGHVSASRLRY